MDFRILGRTCDLLIYGHTHRQELRRADGMLIVNPGATRNQMGAGSSVVILDTVEMTTTVRSLDPGGT